MADSTSKTDAANKADNKAETKAPQLSAEEKAEQEAQAAKREVYDALLADLTAHTHVWNERKPLAWAAYDAPQDAAPSRAGKHVVAIQYGAVPGGNGGLLREFVFDFAPGEAKTRDEVDDSGLQ